MATYSGNHPGTPGISGSATGASNGGVALSLTDPQNSIEPGATVYGGAGGDDAAAGYGNGGNGIDTAIGVDLTNQGNVGGGGGSRGTGGIGVLMAGGGTLTNAAIIRGGTGGRISSDVSGYPGGIGVELATSGTVINTNTGSILGGRPGYTPNVSNPPSSAGVLLEQGGTVINAGHITGGRGVYTYLAEEEGGSGIELDGVGRVTNSGVIAGGNGGTYHYSDAYGPGPGGIGVNLVAGGTLENAGQIIGGNHASIGSPSDTAKGAPSDAVLFGNSNSRLIIDPGASFTGAVVANPFFYNIIELSGTTPGTLSNLNTEFTGFQGITVDAGASWDLLGTTTLGGNGLNIALNDGTLVVASTDRLTVRDNLSGNGHIELDSTTAALNAFVSTGQTIDFNGSGDLLNVGDLFRFHAKIGGFTTHDTIDLTGDAGFKELSFNDGVLTVQPTDGINAGTYTIDFLGLPNSAVFKLESDGHGGTDVVLVTPCYRAGTLIRVERGEAPVESLRIGDHVVTHSGELEPIRWIGRRRYAGRFIAGKTHVLPIRIRANALFDDIPRRDLWVSPEHALYLDGYLIPAKDLVNGISITQEPVEQIEYIHIELASHRLIWAEGAAAETFLDDDSRQLFENAEEYVQLYPGEGPTLAHFCAERLTDGYELEGIRRQLAHRAAELWPAKTRAA